LFARREGKTISRLRKIYMARLVGRCGVLLAAAVFYFLNSTQLLPVEPGQFLKKPTLLHALWLVWMGDMIAQLIPAKKNLALGSKKLFVQYFKDSGIKGNAVALKKYVLSTTKAAHGILIIWALLVGALGLCRHQGWIGNRELLMVSILFYVCDLICVLIWCPFRLLLKNRCCTTCRIFNWDHMMMFTPMVWVGSFFSWSLLLVAAVVWVAWELSVFMHPERFFPQSNLALKCENCTDKLCTQYCHKLRRADKN